jgi:hypothetical protein
MANFKKILMAAPAGGETEWALQLKAGDDTQFLGVKENDDFSRYGIFISTRGNGGSPDKLGYVIVDADGTILTDRMSNSSYGDGSRGRTVGYGYDNRWWTPRATNTNQDNRIMGADTGTSFSSVFQSSRNKNPVACASHTDSGILYWGDAGILRRNSGAGIEMPRDDDIIFDIVPSSGSQAVYCLQVGSNQYAYVAKVPNYTLGNTNAKAAGYNSASFGYAFYDERTASLAVKHGASSGNFYAQGGNRILKFSSNGDNTGTTPSIDEMWQITGSPQNQYSLGRIQFDNNSGDNYLYWIGNQNATTGDYVTCVKMDSSGNVQASYKINSNTSNYGELRISTSNRKCSYFTISKTGLVVFGMTARKTTGNSLRAWVVKCSFDNIPNLSGITDSDGDELISSVSSAGCAKSSLSTPSEAYGWSGMSDAGSNTVSTATLSTLDFTATTKLIDLS